MTIRHRIGIIADVQYADIDDVWNFMKTHKRKYRGTLTALRNAIDWWHAEQDIDLIADLGDAIDGFRNENREMGMHALMHVMNEWRRFQSAFPKTPILHLIGNHELYKFTRKELTSEVEGTGFTCSAPANIRDRVDNKESIYYSFKLTQESNWRIVVLDPYEESVMTNGGGRIGHELTMENGGLHPEFTSLCQSKNPNNILDGSNFLKGLTGVNARWVPYNGAMSQDQLDWLDNVMAEASGSGENVLIFSHIVLHPRATPNEDCHALLWNYDKVLELISKHSCVRLVLAAHAHREGYYHCTATGVHHVTIASPLEAPENLAEQTFGILEIGDKFANLIGRGWINSRRMEF